MARTVSITDLSTARFNFFQAIAAENWAAQYPGTEVSYPPGVDTSANQEAAMEELETTYILETFQQ